MKQTFKFRIALSKKNQMPWKFHKKKNLIKLSLQKRKDREEKL